MGYSTQIELLVIARVVVARALGLRRTTGLHLLHGHTILCRAMGTSCIVIPCGHVTDQHYTPKLTPLS